MKEPSFCDSFMKQNKINKITHAHTTTSPPPHTGKHYDVLCIMTVFAPGEPCLTSGLDATGLEGRAELQIEAGRAGESVSSADPRTDTVVSSISKEKDHVRRSPSISPSPP